MPIIVHFLLLHPATACTDIILLLRKVHVVHEPTVHDPEVLVYILDSKLVEHFKKNLGTEINDDVP
jgi:hypothetical protein